MRRLIFLWLCFIVLTKCNAYQKDTLTNSSQSEVHPERLAIVLSGSALILTAAHIQNYNSWWKGERSRFHFSDGGIRTLSADKAGHFYFTYVSSDLLNRSFYWAGVERSKSLLYAAAISLSFQLYVETEDGFTKALGFSGGDALADIAGALYPTLQYYVPWFEDVRFKWSCYPSARFRAGSYQTIIDDYESMYFWLSLGRKVFPSFTESILPSFLCIAVGYGVTGLDRSDGGNRELFIGLDYDFTRLPGRGSFLTAVKQIMNYIHFPAPTIRVTPRVILYGFHF
jgi:hypothetical protein